jgi:4-amino-4-deoxy-L-arabinose transferase-like glycosyltransferase
MASHPDYAHLPEGREPGWQTQNASREARRQVGIWMMFLIGVAMIGVGIYFTVEPANPGRPQPDILALAFFGGIGLGVIVWGEILRRRGMPKPPPFSVEVEDTEVRRGESSRARVECLAPAKVKRPVTVGVVCREFYTVLVKQHMGNNSNPIDVEEAREVEVATTTQSLSPGDGPVTVEFTIPEDAPYSYEGRYVSLAWSVVVEEATPFRRKRAIDPFWVLP